jgi:thioredoxin
MPTVELNKENFESTITGNAMVLVDFWAPWCGPCRSFAPVYEQIAEKHPDVVFGKVNTEEQRELAGAFGIRSIPTLMIFREQIILFEQPGAMPGTMLDELIAKVREVDMEQVRRDIAAQEQTNKAAS